MRSNPIPLLIAVYLLALAAPALASDGVLEINQTCAVDTGCFPGDEPGFPVTITGVGGGSYRLTSDLALSNPATDGISIATSNVTLDLGGFMIRCRTFSFPVFSLCGASSGGTGDGVRVTDPVAITAVEVRGGSIVGMGGAGVVLGSEAVVRDLRVLDNGDSGVAVRANSIVSDNIVRRNGLDGVALGTDSLVSGNTVSDNGSRGVFGQDGMVVSGNSISRNGQAGIAGLFAFFNIQGNMVRGNQGFGISGLALGAAYRDNVISGNAGGTVSGGIDSGGNVCDFSTTCP